ncbi:hypothetical protein SAMN05216436_105163 [bacterium A37T11]|nr:hypothetical protein SAMN05216436_105163 [bacterium A37T11]
MDLIISRMQVGKELVFRAVLDGEAVFFEYIDQACRPVPGSKGDVLLLNKIAKSIDLHIK